MLPRPLRPLVLAGSALTLGVTALAAPSVVAATPSSYVALGDSYSSGTGTRTYLNDGTSRQRSVYAYPSLISSARGYALNFRACSGAKVADVRSTQLGALTSSTSYVTISVGGNDAGFTDVLTQCALPSWASNCNGAIDGAEKIINTTLPTALGSLYAAIRSRAPGATVVVVGYPRIFNGQDCNLLTWFSPSEETRLNKTADLLNGKLSAAARVAGFGFADPTSRFVGHAVCGSPEWLNGLSNPVGESYHPNRTGHSAGYTPLVSPSLTGATVAATAAVLRTARASAPTVTARQKRYAARDRAIRPERFVAPDLRSPAVRKKAARAGVNLRSRASIDAVDRSYSRAQAKAWAARH